MLKRVALGFAFAAVLAFAVAPMVFSGDKPANPCPMDKITKAWYCATCKAFTGDWCGKCTADKMCDACKKASMCEKCKKAGSLVDCCVRTAYQCDGDKVCQLEAGDCPKCKKPLVKKDVRALVVWKCPDCGADLKEGGKCEKCKKDAVKACSMSGTCPHCGPEKK